MTDLFQLSEGDVAVVSINGVYYQCNVYTRNGYLYIRMGSGFIKLYASGVTSKASCRLDTLHFEKQLYRDDLGRLVCDNSLSKEKLKASDYEILKLGRK